MISNVLHNIQPSEWVQMVGRGALQDYQDCFARDTRIPIHLIDRRGNPLLIPSKKLFFCDFVKTSVNHDCSGVNRINMENVVAHYDETHSFEPLVKCCDFGISSFVAPVYFNGNLMGFWHCPGFTYADSPHAKQLHAKFDLPILTHKAFTDALSMLVIICHLLDIHLDSTPRLSAVEPASDQTISSQLTRRENEVASLVCCGMSNAQIASKLYVSEKTIKTHLSNIFSKLGVRNRVQLICEYSSAMDTDGHSELEVM